MDQIKTGKFIAELRRQRGLTQESLGEKIGVTNKTISRWENGNYMPDIGMLPLLAEQLGTTVPELLAGERVEGSAPAKENKKAAPSLPGSFTREEKTRYFKRKWRRDHLFFLIALGAVLVGSVVLPILLRQLWMLGLTPVLSLLAYGWQHNRMMAYVERCLYD